MAQVQPTPLLTQTTYLQPTLLTMVDRASMRCRKAASWMPPSRVVQSRRSPPCSMHKAWSA